MKTTVEKEKHKYQNTRTGEIRDIEVEVDENGRCNFYQYVDGDEWKPVSRWCLNLVNSSEFFRSAHENTVRFKNSPLDGSGMPYGIT